MHSVYQNGKKVTYDVFVDEDNVCHGHCITYYPSDDDLKIKYEEFYYVNGKREGPYTKYDKSGSITTTSYYVNDKENGVRTNYHAKFANLFLMNNDETMGVIGCESGQPMVYSKTTYVNGFPLGLVELFNNTGDKTGHFYVKEGHNHGPYVCLQSNHGEHDETMNLRTVGKGYYYQGSIHGEFMQYKLHNKSRDYTTRTDYFTIVEHVFYSHGRLIHNFLHHPMSDDDKLLLAIKYGAKLLPK